MEMAAIHYCFENTQGHMEVGVEEQYRHVHTSFDNSSHSPDTPKRDHTLALQDRSSLPDQVRSDRYIDISDVTVTVMFKMTVTVKALDQSHSHRR